MKIFINGRFLTQKITGVQRVGIEVTKELDKIAKPDEIELLCPPGIINEIELKNIKVTIIGEKSDNKWVQFTLPRYVRKRKGVILTMAGMIPILKPDYYVAHDATFVRFPKTFTRKFVFSYNINYRLALCRCKKIFTISQFSQKELCNIFKINAKKFIRITPASQHLINQKYEYVPISKWGLMEDKYYLSVGSQTRHKNQQYIYECAKKYPQKTFVIAGGNPKTFSEYYSNTADNLVYTGYISNNELYSLYEKAKGFIFPSLYEGFGLPPLEAMTMGVKHVAVSNIEVFREIYNKDVYFFNPKNIDDFDIDKLDYIEITNQDLKYYLTKYSWNKTANIIYKAIKDNEKEQ